MKETATQICKILQDNGFKAVFAGGAVRDMLLGIEPHDIDIATDCSPDQVEALFDRTVPVGKSFGVVRVLMNGFEFEVATFREDAKTGDGRRPDSVTFSTMQADAMRRDLTINGMFWDPIMGVLHDFVDGRRDLQSKKIRFIGNPVERIEEDALRMLRAVRFAVKFDATLTGKDSLAISDNAWRVEKLSGERIFDEMTKILRLHKPRAWMPFMWSSGLMKQILPEVSHLMLCEQGAPFHCEGNAFEHTIRVLEALPSDASDELLWGALLHDIGKPRTSAPSKSRAGSFSFHGHDNVGAEMAIELLSSRFKCSNDFVFTVSGLVRDHMKLHSVREFRTCTLRRFLANPNLDLLIQLGIADELGCSLAADRVRDLSWVDWLKEAKNQHGSLPVPVITGATLIEMGMVPGPLFKKILALAFDWQLEGIDTSIILKRVKGIS